MKKKIVKILAGITMLSILAGCGTSDNHSDNAGTGSNTDIKTAAEIKVAGEQAGQNKDDESNKTGESNKQRENVTNETVHAEHVYNESRKDATCTEAGQIIYTCKICGETYTETDPAAPAKGHSYVMTKIAPTCEENGKNVYTCSICGDSYMEDDASNPALGHDYSSNTIVAEATEYSPGTRRFTCARCGNSHDAAYGYAHKVSAYNGTKTVYGYWDTACEQEILELLNDYRVSLGLKPLSMNRTMSDTAHVRAKEIAYSYRHNHSRPTNERWRTAYPEDDFCGENIASGQADAQEVTTGWIESPDHNENMVNTRFRTIGIGVFVRVDCPESGEVTEPDPNGLSHEDSRYYVQAFAN